MFPGLGTVGPAAFIKLYQAGPLNFVNFARNRPSSECNFGVGEADGRRPDTKITRRARPTFYIIRVDLGILDQITQ